MSEQIEYTVIIDGYNPDSFKLLSFEGQEFISQTYKFSLSVATKEKNIKLSDLAATNVNIVINNFDKKRYINGVVSKFSQVDIVGSKDSSAGIHYIYSVEIVPPLWKLSLNHSTDFYTKYSIIQIAELLLNKSNVEHRLDLTHEYAKHDFIMQYQEDDLSFLSRLLEYEGVYYYFDHSDKGSLLVLTDSLSKHKECKEKIRYVDSSGALSSKKQSTVQKFIVTQEALPNKLVLRGYSDKEPSVDIRATSVLSTSGVGEQYLCGSAVNSMDKIKSLAAIRAEEYVCREVYYSGLGNDTILYPGLKFNLYDHFNKQINDLYHLIEIKHYGVNHIPGISGNKENNESSYYNEFIALSGKLQFRPQRLTPKPRVYGGIIGEIIAEGDGKYADINKNGYYKVQFRYDRVGDSTGSAHHWIRMTQPYGGRGGSSEGFQMPLRAGAEVLIIFNDGDPDQPLIIGVVPNSRNISVIGGKNNTNSQSVISSPGGSKLKLEDKEGFEEVGLSLKGTSSISMHRYTDFDF